MKRLLFRNRFSVTLVLVAFAALPSIVSADLVAHSQDFEAVGATDPAALSGDGWLVFGNVYGMDLVYRYGYGPFPAPNNFDPPPAAFSAIAVGQGGVDQGDQQLSVFSDYENTDHDSLLVESNVFREQTIGAADVGHGWVFQFDAKLGNLEGSTTAVAFIKTLDPANGYALTNFLTEDMTSIPPTWGTYFVTIRIDAGLVGQILQIGFANTATAYEGSGVYYDNIFFFLDDAVSAPGLAATGDHGLLPASPNPFRRSTEIRFVVPGREAVRIDVYDVLGRRVARILDGTLPAGQHRVTWSGLDSAGRAVASGTYFYRMEAAGFSETRAFTRIR